MKTLTHQANSLSTLNPQIISSTHNQVTFKGDNLNPFINAANPLLTLMVQLKHCESPPDLEQTRQQIINEIKLFEKKLTQLNYPQRTILAARYCICTAIDEAILSTNWGTETLWVQHSLLSLFHQETWGGARFYLILETMAKEPRHNLALLEFLYLILSLGFEGQFFGDKTIMREEIRNRLLHHIRQSRGKVAKRLSVYTEDHALYHHAKQKKKSLKWLALIVSGILFVINIGMNMTLNIKSHPLIKQYQAIGLESPITAYSQLLSRPIIARKPITGGQHDV